MPAIRTPVAGEIASDVGQAMRAAKGGGVRKAEDSSPKIHPGKVCAMLSPLLQLV